MMSPDPPAYDVTSDSKETTPSGFPTGYFIIKNCATGRLLDIATSSSADGTHAVLWTEKEHSNVISMRNPAADNQVFFVDYTGALCSKASGHALDVEGDRLVLRHRKPFTLPFPNSESHPLPKITYSSSSKLLRITFGSNPKYPPPGEIDPKESWRSKDYVVTAVPLQKPRSFLENTMAMMSNIGVSLSKPHGLVTHIPSHSPTSLIATSLIATSPITPSFRHDATDFALRDYEVSEEDRLGGEDDTDDSPEPGRPVSVLELSKGWQEIAGSKAAMERRAWEIISLTHKVSSSQRRATLTSIPSHNSGSHA